MSETYYTVSRSALVGLADTIREKAGITGELVFPTQFQENIPTVPQLHAPTVSLSGSVLTVNNPSTNGDFASTFVIKNGSTQLTTTSATTVDLSSLLTEVGSYSISAATRGINFKDSSSSAAVDYNIYSITTTVTDGTYSGATKISQGGTATVTIAKNVGFILPSTVTVTNATHSYDSSTGVITLSNPTGSVTITAVCVLGIIPPTTELSGNILSITNNDEKTTNFDIYVDNTKIATIDNE